MFTSFSGLPDFKKNPKDTPLEFNLLFPSFVKLPVTLKRFNITKNLPMNDNIV